MQNSLQIVLVLLVNENKTTKSKGFTSLITVEVKTATETRKVAGTLLNGLGGRISNTRILNVYT